MNQTLPEVMVLTAASAETIARAFVRAGVAINHEMGQQCLDLSATGPVRKVVVVVVLMRRKEYCFDGVCMATLKTRGMVFE